MCRRHAGTKSVCPCHGASLHTPHRHMPQVRLPLTMVGQRLPGGQAARAGSPHHRPRQAPHRRAGTPPPLPLPSPPHPLRGTAAPRCPERLPSPCATTTTTTTLLTGWHVGAAGDGLALGVGRRAHRRPVGGAGCHEEVQRHQEAQEGGPGPDGQAPHGQAHGGRPCAAVGPRGGCGLSGCGS